MQLEELTTGLEQEEIYMIKDYLVRKKKRNESVALNDIRNLDTTSLIDAIKIANVLGYENFESYEDVAVYPRGYRILSKVPRVPANIVDNLVNNFKSFQHILMASIEQLDEVEGIGEVRAKAIKQALKRMQEQFVFDNVML